MASQKPDKLPWRLLVSWELLLVGLLVLAHRLVPSPGWRQIAELGIILLTYGWIALRI